MAGFVGEPPRAEPPPRDEPRHRSGFNTGSGNARSSPWDEPDEPEPVSDVADFAEQLLDRVAADQGAAHRASFKDIAFLRDLVDRAYHGPASPKQAKWLRDIEAKLTSTGRRSRA